MSSHNSFGMQYSCLTLQNMRVMNQIFVHQLHQMLLLCSLFSFNSWSAHLAVDIWVISGSLCHWVLRTTLSGKFSTHRKGIGSTIAGDKTTREQNAHSLVVCHKTMFEQKEMHPFTSGKSDKREPNRTLADKLEETLKLILNFRRLKIG